MAPLSLAFASSLLATLSSITLSNAFSIEKRIITNPGPPGWSYLGCYTDGVNGAPRTLPNGVTNNVPGGYMNMTVPNCVTACKAAGYNIAGVEYSQECWCANTIGANGVPASSGCSSACKGNANEYCGGGNRMNMYQYGTATSTSSAATSTSSTTSSSSSIQTSTTSSMTTSSSSTSTSSSTTSSASSAATGLPSGWTYRGCYVDNKNGRILINAQPASNTMTNEKCVAACQTAGYSVAGMEYGQECYCGNAIINGGNTTAESDCNMACAGNSAEKCGAGNRMSIYANGTLTTFDVSANQKTGLPGKWQYAGCISEGQNQRIWKWQTILANNNSATECLTRCSNFGFMAGGMEYGQECYCGDVTDIATNGGTVRPESECSTTCPGDPRYNCGAGSRLSYYAWNLTDPLYKWSYPTGNAAGNYKLLIGGVVVPLITTLGVNGKYTYVEKHGTGAANSTGAYELDLSQSSNFTAAWRTMNGLKTDVFCSAGLTLPDKVGRQINIGGWSGTSTFGIRTYWPDGSPGVPSKNDWQENAADVHLQKGRWYPSAMIMSNGSILVVGGEDGSNGNPVPSMELLPGGGPVITFDFLQRTDPENLYPFLTTMPSGAIFIGYYNEARLLDPVNFNTIKVLPNIPGNVNNPQAGRTYPLEGTAMIMPQYAPYTDPVTMFICGGSTVGNALANDNCVSIQPEATNATWTLERMPSQRVMPCIAALPDGTYLIVNGAQQGVAGFGLANTPNLNAILYDPTKPVNQRMSVMANTTVARLYHSEALVMQDGRVMVSGSDPQDGKNPEEYRIEVFEPPYALSGLPKPTYTITNTDWSYGQQVQITITSGNIANIKVSLLGAVSSTHGNSMGQRTIFPAISCAGSTCTITAPPDNKVSPPGWHQMFVLDGPTPSMSTWVRIGGDPAQLGNWPPSSSFTKPGI